MPDQTSTLSVAIITLNEEDRLAECLGGLSFADEVVVVDSGSQDRTVRIAEEYGARVFSRGWTGFGAQKQYAIEQCRSTWVLVLDADELVPEETAAEIRRTIHHPGGLQAFSLARRNYLGGRWVRHGGWWPDRTTRLFRRGTARMSPRQVHEALEVEGAIGQLEHPLLHHPFRDLSEMMVKMDRYSTAGARELAEAGKRGTIPQALSRAGWAWFHTYLLRGGFLDRGAGVILAISGAVNVFFKYAKLAEIGRQQRGTVRR